MRPRTLIPICLLASTGLARAQEAELFVRGDADGSGRLQVTDAVVLLQHLATGSPGQLGCPDAADADDSGTLDLADAVMLLEFLFRRGLAPAFPFPHCAPDPSDDRLGCTTFPSCRPLWSFLGQEFAGDSVIFTLDRSASMLDGGNLDRAKGAIAAALADLPQEVHFAVVTFDSGYLCFPSCEGFVDGHVPELVAATPETVAAASAWLEDLRAGNGTCPHLGLGVALETSRRSQATRKVVMYVGDGAGSCHGEGGEPYLTTTLEQVAEANGGRAQINAFGYLDPWDWASYPWRPWFLRTLAAENGGVFVEIGWPRGDAGADQAQDG